jgi:two-component system, NarL family, nitrate/nitrite response regulator NarL
MNTPLSSARRALLIEDHEIVINAVAACLRTHGLLQMFDKVASLGEARALLDSGEKFSMVILDLNLSDARGLEALAALAESWPDLPKLVYSGDDSVDTMARAFELGALGFVAKNEPTSELTTAVDTVLRGRPHLPRKLLEMKGLISSPLVSLPTASVNLTRAGVRLTARQLEVVEMVGRAMPNKVIAAHLDLSEGTVKSHLNTIFRAIGARNRMELLLRAQELGLVSGELPERKRPPAPAF